TKDELPKAIPTPALPLPLVNGHKDKPRDEVDSLLSAFEVSGEGADVSRDLKAIAGLDLTPSTTMPVAAEPDETGGIESLLAMTHPGAAAAAAPRPDLPAPLPSPYSAAQKEPGRRAMPSYADERQMPTGPTLAKTRRRTHPDERPHAQRRGTDLVL